MRKMLHGGCARNAPSAIGQSVTAEHTVQKEQRGSPIYFLTNKSCNRLFNDAEPLYSLMGPHTWDDLADLSHPNSSEAHHGKSC